MATIISGVDEPVLERKWVYYEGTSTIYEGTPLCYNYDSTDNWLGWGEATAGADPTEQGTTADGEQNEGKYIRVEDVSSTNFQWLAGYVAGSARHGQTGPFMVEIYVAKPGCVIPVRTNADCTANTTVLGLSDGAVYLGASTGDDDPIGCAVAMETVDRSSANGIVLAKVCQTGQVVVGNTFYFLPSITRNGRAYGCTIDGANFFGGAAGAQEYLFHLTGDKDVAASGDCYGGILKIQGENESTNATTYIFRSLNCATHNSGTLDRIENFLGAKNETDGTATNVIGLTALCENYGTTTTGFCAAIDAVIRDETGDTTDRAGIRIRTDDRSGVTAVPAAIKIEAHASSNSFSNLFAFDATTDVSMSACTGDVTVDGNDLAVPVDIDGDTYYLILVDSVPAG